MSTLWPDLNPPNARALINPLLLLLLVHFSGSSAKLLTSSENKNSSKYQLYAVLQLLMVLREVVRQSVYFDEVEEGGQKEVHGYIKLEHEGRKYGVREVQLHNHK